MLNYPLEGVASSAPFDTIKIQMHSPVFQKNIQNG